MFLLRGTGFFSGAAELDSDSAFSLLDEDVVALLLLSTSDISINTYEYKYKGGRALIASISGISRMGLFSKS